MSRSADRSRPLAWPIFLLVVVSVLVTAVISFAVTFSGPPPFEPPRSLTGIARALKGEQPRPWFGGDRLMAPPGGFRPHRAPLQRERVATPPRPRRAERANAEAAARLALTVAVPRSDVVAFTQPGRSEGEAFAGDWTFAWRRGDGWWMVRSQQPPWLTRWHVRTLLALLAAILLLSIPGWWLARALTRPLRQLAAAADRAGTGAPLPDLPGGSREIRDLARAVSTMHARLASHAEARTAMLAGIAHDLGTPLARLAFRVEGLPDAARARAAADIEEMRAMIGATLVFARDDAAATALVRLDLASLLDSLVHDLKDIGAAVESTGGPRAIVRGDSGALRRLFANLVENAMRYGEQARLGWIVDDGRVTVTIDDVGPGVDPALAERLFQPFVRGDPSRNRMTGGTGLGLAIVRTIATAHGGAVTLGNGATGAQARVVLPLSA